LGITSRLILWVAHAGEQGPPAYFGGYVLENYLAIQRGLDLSRSDLVLLARNSFEASFLELPDKRRWMAAINAYARQCAVRP
jgi:adenosine deaminase